MRRMKSGQIIESNRWSSIDNKRLTRITTHEL
nr:MAG TPA: hypothetical protein [Myoviridae sp. ctfuG5]